MQFPDFSPSSSPTADQQQDALQKGLGRAMQWALAGRLNDEPLLDACLLDQRHDMQVEESRANWLWEMVQAVQGAARFRGQILEALCDLSDERSANQLCELGFHYAAAGDETFHRRLYDIVEQKPIADCPLLGETEILRLDGENAFLFAVRVRGEHLAQSEWDWTDDNLIFDAVEQFGENAVIDLLENATESGIRKFHEEWNREKKRASKQRRYPTHKEMMQALSVADIIAEAEKEQPQVGWFRGWGMHATDGDLEKVLQRLWRGESPKVIGNLLRIFSNRSLPVFDSRLIEFCKHHDERVRWSAFQALAMNTHASIRDFALANLRDGNFDRFTADLFIRNYVEGDENQILDVLDLPDDSNELHWLLMDVIKILQNNNEADPSKLATIVYACTPCENCRFDAAKLLHVGHATPDWIIAECRYDSSERCRELFRRLPSSTE